jgi:hypothetical protein
VREAVADASEPRQGPERENVISSATRPIKFGCRQGLRFDHPIDRDSDFIERASLFGKIVR